MGRGEAVAGGGNGRWTVGAKRGEEMPFDGMKGLGEDAKVGDAVVEAAEAEARGSTRLRPRGAEEDGGRRAAEGRSIGLGGRDEAEAMVWSNLKSNVAGGIVWTGTVGVKLKSQGGKAGKKGFKHVDYVRVHRQVIQIFTLF
jgi:hypothetical protein